MPGAAGQEAKQGQVRQQRRSSLVVLPWGDVQTSAFYWGLLPGAPRAGKVEENVSVTPAPCTAADGTKLRHHERAQLLEPSCTPRTGATETITAAIKKKRSWGQGKARTSPFVSPQELLQHRWGGGSWLVRCQHPRASGRKGLK